jgi:hypothetical protein
MHPSALCEPGLEGSVPRDVAFRPGDRYDHRHTNERTAPDRRNERGQDTSYNEPRHVILSPYSSHHARAEARGMSTPNRDIMGFDYDPRIDGSIQSCAE